MTPAPIDALAQINLDDLVNAFGWQNHARLSHLLRRLFRAPARLFAQQILDFDAAIGVNGLAEASRRIERFYARDMRVFCADRIPDGPILALANHPGLTDTLALFCALRRDDLKIIALDRPFLQSLPNISNQLFYVTGDSSQRISLVRRVSEHLRAGGAALTFPAGHTEPDPDIYGGAADSLQRWTDSAGVFLRLAPETAILPICVRGVTWNAAAHHPIARLRRAHDDRQLLASALQLLSHLVLKTRPVTVKVQIGRPVTVKDLGAALKERGQADTQVIHQAVLAEMKRLIENPPEGEGVSVL